VNGNARSIAAFAVESTSERARAYLILVLAAASVAIVVQLGADVVPELVVHVHGARE
jgi:hypothetical protein